MRWSTRKQRINIFAAQNPFYVSFLEDLLFFTVFFFQCILSIKECRTSPHNKQVVNFCNFRIKIRKLFYLLGVMYPGMIIKMKRSIVAQCPDMCCRSWKLTEEMFSSKQKAKPRKPVWVLSIPVVYVCAVYIHTHTHTDAAIKTTQRFGVTFKCSLFLKKSISIWNDHKIQLIINLGTLKIKGTLCCN